MKKIIVAAALIVAASAFLPMQASAKKDKKQKKAAVEQKQPIVLQSASDSISYAAGVGVTPAILQMLQQQMQADTAYMADIVRGYRDAIAKGDDPRQTAYIAGQMVADQVIKGFIPYQSQPFEGSEITIVPAKVHEGLLDGLNNDTTVYTRQQASTLVNQRIQTIRQAQEEAYKAENVAWLAENAKKEGVQTTATGLQYKVIKQGTGAVPVATDEVEVIYEGKTIDGNVFDATSRHQGKSTDFFRCNQVIKGWTEALTMMPVGSKWEIYIPQELAYGNRSMSTIKPYSTLIFTVELVSIKAPETKETETPTKPQKRTKPAAKRRR